MNKFVKYIDMCVRKFWILFCCIIFVGSIFVKAMYNMYDYPYFVRNTILDIILFIMMLLGYYILFKYSYWIEKKIHYLWIWILFGGISCLYIFLVPITPFSDMEYVAKGAVLFSKFDISGILSSEYLQMITKNLKVSMFYGFLGVLLPKTFFSYKFINVVLYLLTAYFLGMISDNLGYKCSKTTSIIVCSYLPLFIYCNHIYFDIPTLFLCTVAVWFYTKEKSLKNMIFSSVFLGIACSLRVLALLFFIAMSIDYIFFYNKQLLRYRCKKIWALIFFCVIALSIPKAVDFSVNACFRQEDAEDESIWTLFWMGINEEEFGFMHNEIADGDKTFNDFYQLLISRNAKQNVQLFGRKIFWEWSQGTYQAERYGFGYDVTDPLEKFEYETPLTKYLMNNEQKTRNLIKSTCRAQYMALFFLMLIGLLKFKKEDYTKYRMLLYLLFGTFLILIFYELKSRYVFHCIIPMLLLGIRGLKGIRESITKYQNSCK